MTNVKIWAPKAQKATLVLARTEEEVELAKIGNHFVLDQPLSVGTQYYVRLDGGMRLPDPRSMCQPDGPHGPSEIVDPSTFEWTDDDWRGENLHGKVFYEMHVGTFTPRGTFRSAIERLGYLKDLGVDVIQLLPIAPMPGERGWGYDGVSIFALHHPYGRPEDLVALIDAIHGHGMSACLDVVYNHFGPDGNYLAQFGPYFSSWHHTPWGEALNLDGEDSESVRRYLIDNAKQWMRDYHFDALRLDAVHHLLDNSDRHFLAQLSEEIAELGTELGRTLTLTAESEDNDAAMVTPVKDGGYGMDMQWADDIHHALHVWLTGETNAYYADYADDAVMPQAFEHGFVRVGQELTFESAPRGKPIPEGMSGHHFMAFDENHDQVGNRMISDRPSLKLEIGELAISRALILLSHYTPMLFMGEEFATRTPFHYFTDHGEELGPLIKEGRLAEFANWDMTTIYGDIPATMLDPQDEQTFISSKLNWEEVDAVKHRRMLGFVKDLIRIRKSDPDIASGDRSQTSFVLDGDSGWMTRGSTVVVFSRSSQPVNVPAPVAGKKQILSWEPPTLTDDGHVRFVGPSVAVFR
ncbi:maltooligosyltrehalose trehalohydrolase [Trueperella bonasi]|uniref:Malto-oligosyltrehalose trehalohydrolase n=1 Tax=Trueperella bonasi TaxID=312286 RepID=A0ABT9NIB3_9ACTO|nr:malto-oligosyltrehalose trehalohydrolase [Trueperella bonasi]MDP9807139.1 maltooligosyltrehalose trehalohydrolase [Trueperella bonasi]